MVRFISSKSLAAAFSLFSYPLTHVTLNKVHGDISPLIIRCHKSLKFLELHLGYVDTLDMTFVDHMKKLHKLKTLSLVGDYSEESSEEMFEVLNNIGSAVKSVYLYGFLSTDDTVIDKNLTLKKLVATDCMFEGGLSHLISKMSETLEQLIFHDVDPDDGHTDYIRFSDFKCNFPNLKILHLYNTVIDVILGNFFTKTPKLEDFKSSYMLNSVNLVEQDLKLLRAQMKLHFYDEDNIPALIIEKSHKSLRYLVIDLDCVMETGKKFCESISLCCNTLEYLKIQIREKSFYILIEILMQQKMVFKNLQRLEICLDNKFNEDW